VKRFPTLLAGFAALTVYVSPYAGAADSLRRDVGPNTSPAYEKECGSCHFAYQPAWLPERSWRAIMGSLDRHFDSKVAIPDRTRDGLLAHLVANSADRLKSLRSVQVLASIREADTPRAVTQVPYVSGIHGGFLDPAFRGQPRVESLVNCNACHARAASGAYSSVQYVVTDEAFRTGERDSRDGLSAAERLVLRKK
jgi:hypothetical protein